MLFFEQIGYLIQNYWPYFLDGLWQTLILALVGTIGGLILGMGLAMLRNIKVNPKDNLFIRVIKWIVSKLSFIYIQLFRGTPMMVQAMIIYFGIFAGSGWSYLAVGLIIITINTAAYMAENVRSGINSVDHGQIEAARSLGMTQTQTMIHVVFPQALKNSIPTFGNEFIVNIKDSSVLNVITVTELFMAAKIAAANTYMTLPSYAIICLIYLLLTLISTELFKRIEISLDDDHLMKVKKYGQRKGEAYGNK